MYCSNEPSANITMQRDPIRLSDVHPTTLIYGEVEFDRTREANGKVVSFARIIFPPKHWANSLETI